MSALPTSERYCANFGDIDFQVIEQPAGVGTLYAGHAAGVGQDDGMFKHVTGSNVTSLGVVRETTVVTVAGSKTVQIEQGIKSMNNSADNPVGVGDINKICYQETTDTVSIASGSLAPAGRVAAVLSTGSFGSFGVTSATAVFVDYSYKTPVAGEKY